MILTVLSALAVIVLAHLPLWLLRPYTSMPQPLFELDLLLSIVGFSLNRWVGGVAVAVAWSLSLLRAVAVNYHFHNTAEFIDSLRFADLLSYSAFMTWSNALIAGLVLLAIAGIFRGMMALSARAHAVLLLTALLGIADIANGSATAVAWARDLPFAQVNILGSPGYNLLRSEQSFMKDGSQPLTVLDPVPRSYAALRAAADDGRAGNLLVLVESLGEPVAPEIRAWLMDQLRTPGLLARWDVDDGTEAFVGGTIAGELRVLCGVRGHYSRLTETTAHDCLPRRFQARGEETVAMHGFSPRMFDRARWWPIAGFSRIHFADDMVQQGGARCPGAFNGICDHDVIAAALKEVGARGPFVYALTINTHLPLPSETVSGTLDGLCRRHEVPRAACQLLQAQGRLFADLAVQLAAALPLVDQVVVVGDHSPPFNDFRDREVFNPKRVPSLILRRRPCV